MKHFKEKHLGYTVDISEGGSTQKKFRVHSGLPEKFLGSRPVLDLLIAQSQAPSLILAGRLAPHHEGYFNVLSSTAHPHASMTTAAGQACPWFLCIHVRVPILDKSTCILRPLAQCSSGKGIITLAPRETQHRRGPAPGRGHPANLQ